MELFTKRRLIVLSISVLLIGLIWWIYTLRPKQTMSSMVPDHASFYLEVDKPLDVLKNVQKGIRLFSNPNLTFFAEWQNELVYVQNLLKNEASISQYLKKATIGISAHVLTGKETNYLFYFPLNTPEQDKLFELLKKFYGNSLEYTFHVRNYLNTEIAEITFKKDGRSFSIAKGDGTLCGSFSGFLVEEVIRKSGLNFKPNFVDRLKKDPRFTNISSRSVRMFINPDKMADYFYQYLNPNMQGLKLMGSLGEGIALGFSQPNNVEWKTEGYLINENPKEKGNHSVPILKEAHQFLNGREAFSFEVSMADLWNWFPGKLPQDSPESTRLVQAINPEFMLIFFEGEGLKKYDRMLVFRIKNQQALFNFLQSLEIKNEGKSPYSEVVGRYEIRQHSNPRLGSILAGNLLADWNPLFYARVGEQLVLTDDIDILRGSLAEKETKKVEPTSETNPAFIQWKANSIRTIPFLSDNAAGIFKKNFKDWVPLFKGIQEIVFSDNGESENPSVTLNIKLRIPSATENSWNEIQHNVLDSTIISPVTRLEWKSQNRIFWVVQQKNFRTSILDHELKEISSFRLFGPWTSKPQLLENPTGKFPTIMLTTAKSIRFYSTDGKEVSPSPLLLPDTVGVIDHSRLIDYDKSLQYRIAITSRYGDVYMADMQGKFLDGWNPWRYTTQMSMAPRHIRIGSQDLIILMDKNGKLNVVNRKGEKEAGFPLQLSGRSDQAIYLEPGLDLKTTYIYTLSELGHVEKVNLEGLSVSKIQLYRPDKDTRFQFCIDQGQKTFAIAQFSGNSVTLFDQSYRPIFETVLKNQNCYVQHFHFGAGYTIYALVDQVSSLLQLYNESGQLINPEPIPCDQLVDIIPQPTNPEAFNLIKIRNKRVSMISFAKD